MSYVTSRLIRSVSRSFQNIPSNFHSYSPLHRTTSRHIHSLPTFRSFLPLRRHCLTHSPPPSSSLISRRTVFVQIAQTPNPLSLKFIPTGYNVLPPPSEDDPSGSSATQTLDMSSYKEAMNKSGLARELFIIEGIKNVFMTTEYVTVTVTDATDWPEIQGQVVGLINDFLLSNKPILESAFQFEEEENYDDDDEVVAIIRELIDTRIRPNVQYDGGDVIFKGFDHETGKLSLQLVGACKGCDSSAETLHNGIERMIKFYVPEVTAVEEFLDEEELKLQEINQMAFEKVEQKLQREEAA